MLNLFKTTFGPRGPMVPLMPSWPCRVKKQVSCWQSKQPFTVFLTLLFILILHTGVHTPTLVCQEPFRKHYLIDDGKGCCTCPQHALRTKTTANFSTNEAKVERSLALPSLREDLNARDFPVHRKCIKTLVGPMWNCHATIKNFAHRWAPRTRISKGALVSG